MHSSACHAILSRRPDGEFQYDEINPATLKLYGMTRAQVIGRTTTDILPLEQAAEVNAYLEACLRAGTPITYTRKKGKSVLDAVATPIPAEPGHPAELPSRRAT